MSDNNLLPVILEREAEKLRQEKETFDQLKQHEERWFTLRLIIGYLSIVLLSIIIIISSYIILNHNAFPMEVIIAAGAALFGDVLGLLICVWKIVLNTNFMATLEPATKTIQSYDNIIPHNKKNIPKNQK